MATVLCGNGPLLPTKIKHLPISLGKLRHLARMVDAYESKDNNWGWVNCAFGVVC